VSCKDTPGLIVNRLLVPYLMEAIRMVERGDASAKVIHLFFIIILSIVKPLFQFADPHQDPAFHFDADPDPITHFFPDLDSPMLRNDPLRLPPFHFDADPDPDPAFPR
jgi:hypothetical protein